MNVEAVRAFVGVAETGQFQEAAIDLGVTQQAVSKRIASLERHLGTPLFRRGRRGVELTVDGEAFLPHAKAVLLAVRWAVESVQPGRRALRVDILGRKLVTADLMLAFHQRHPDLQLDMFTLGDAASAFDALLKGSVDVSFCGVHDPGEVPGGIAHCRIHDEPLELLVGPRHRLAGAGTVRLGDLAGLSIWAPGISAASEWGSYYQALIEDFGISIDLVGPDFGLDHFLERMADSAALATLVSGQMRDMWSARHDVRRVRIVEPTPVYPWSLAWHTANAHPGLALLREDLARHGRSAAESGRTWLPGWARRAA